MPLRNVLSNQENSSLPQWLCRSGRFRVSFQCETKTFWRGPWFKRHLRVLRKDWWRSHARCEIIYIFSDAHAEHHEYADFGEAGDHEDHEHEEHQHDEVHQYVGLALLTGFLLMLMIDNIGGDHGHSHGADGHGHGSTLVAEKNIER